MRRCRRTGWCRDCPDRAACPRSVREDRRARRSKQMSASPKTLRRAAELLDGRWLTAFELGRLLYAGAPDTFLGRKSVAVRARRMVNRLTALGLVAVSPGERHGTRLAPSKYTLVDGGLEEVPC